MPRCIAAKNWAIMLENDERQAGKDTRVLERAAVTRRAPIFFWYMREVEPAELDDEGQIVTYAKYAQTELVQFQAVAPRWAINLARRLMDDQALVEKFGRFNVEKREPNTRSYRARQAVGRGEDPSRKKVIPIELRARIISIAAQSAMTRELFDDDLDAALTLIRDSL